MTGRFLALIAVCLYTPDALLVQLIGLQRTPHGTIGASLAITTWKNIFAGTLTLAAGVALNGGVRATVDGLRTGPMHVLLATILQCTNQIGFTMSFLLADTATALILINLNPLYTALLGWLLLGDALPLRTIVALLCALLSLVIVFAPTLLGASDAEQTTASSQVGNIFSFATGVSVALFVTVVRHAATACPHASMNASAGFGGLCAGAAAAAAATVRASELVAGTAWPWFWAFSLADASCLAAAFVLQNLALRSITGVELALVLLLQTLLAPLLVFAVLGVRPDAWTIAGGTVLVGVLALHELAGMRARAVVAASAPSLL